MDILTLLIIILIVAWALGAFVIPVGGSLIHILLVVVVIIVLVRLLRGQSVV
jgi:hypothetical protein